MDIEALAGKLTPAQRTFLRTMQRGNEYAWDNQLGPKWKDVGRPLKNEGLMRFVDNPRSSKTIATPRGLAVREYLLREGK